MTKRIVTFGELMLRLKSPGAERLLQSAQFEATFGGAESNVAVALAQWGNAAAFVSVLPANPLGDAAVTELRRFGVDTSHVRRGGDRIGLYFLEAAAGARPGRVTYDRAGSAISAVQPSDFNLDFTLAGADWFHVSGISAAISASAATTTLAFVRAARAKGITVSCDYNHRATLWRYGRAASDVMRELLAEVDVAIASEGEWQSLLGGPSGGAAGSGAPNDPTTLFAAIRSVLPPVGRLVITRRASAEAESQEWRAWFDDRKQFVASRPSIITGVVDRVGAGDAFAAGLIHGLVNGHDAAWALEFGAAAAVLKHSIPGDVIRATADEVERAMDGTERGRVIR